MGCSASSSAQSGSTSGADASVGGAVAENRKVLLSSASSRRINTRLVEEARSGRLLDDDENVDVCTEELTEGELELPRLGIMLTMLAMVYADERRRELLLSDVPAWKVKVNKVFEGSVAPDISAVFGVPYAITGTVSHIYDANFFSVPFVAFRSPLKVVSAAAPIPPGHSVLASPRLIRDSDHTQLRRRLHSLSMAPENQPQHCEGHSPQISDMSSVACSTPRTNSASSPSQFSNRNKTKTLLMRTRGIWQGDAFVTSRGFKVGRAHKQSIACFEALKQEGLMTEFMRLLAGMHTHSHNNIMIHSKKSALVVGHGVGAALAALMAAELAVDNSAYHSRKESPSNASKSQKLASSKQVRKNPGLTRTLSAFGSTSNLHEPVSKDALYTLPTTRVFLYGSPRVFETVVARKLRLLSFFQDNVVRLLCPGDMIPTLYAGEAEHVGEPICYRTDSPADTTVLQDERGYWVRFDRAMHDMDSDQWIDVIDSTQANTASVQLVERNDVMLYMNTLLTGYQYGIAEGTEVIGSPLTPLAEAHVVDTSRPVIQLQTPVASDIIRRKLKSSSENEGGNGIMVNKLTFSDDSKVDSEHDASNPTDSAPIMTWSENVVGVEDIELQDIYGSIKPGADNNDNEGADIGTSSFEEPSSVDDGKDGDGFGDDRESGSRHQETIEGAAESDAEVEAEHCEPEMNGQSTYLQVSQDSLTVGEL
jgi:hypothetical protein